MTTLTTNPQPSPKSNWIKKRILFPTTKIQTPKRFLYLTITYNLFTNIINTTNQKPNKLRFQQIEIPLTNTTKFVNNLIPKPHNKFETLIQPLNSNNKIPLKFTSSNYTTKLNNKNLIHNSTSLTYFENTKSTLSQKKSLPFNKNLSINHPK